MLGDLCLQILRALLSRLGVTFLHKSLPRVRVGDLSRLQDVVEDEVDLKGPVTTRLLAGHLLVVKDLVF